MRRLKQCLRGWGVIVVIFVLLLLLMVRFVSEVKRQPTGTYHTSTPLRNEISKPFFLRKLGSESHQESSKYNSFENALAAKSNRIGEIVLITTDFSYRIMALNLYMTSLAKLSIDNYLFVGSDAKVCGFLNSHGADCYTHFDDKIGDKASNWGTAAFRNKTHFKTKIILDSLLLNYTVLISDADIVFFKNPLEHFLCPECDIQIQSDVSEGNSGFYLSRPTKPSIDLHKKAWELSHKPNALSNQKLLDRNMEKMVKMKQINVKTLSSVAFPNGLVYFEKGKRMFLGDNPCTDCVVVHNNWILSCDGKEFRFKENGLWDVDIDGYYSNPDARYILYSNEGDGANKNTLKRELHALKNALSIGFLLNRIVIMPSFTCYKCKYSACKAPHGRCSLHTHFRVSTFNKHFQSKYREHVFLQHPKVPQSVKESVSPLFIIESGELGTSNTTSHKPDIFTPQNATIGASASEINSWFGDSNFAILKFKSLEGTFSGFPKSAGLFDDMNAKLDDAFKTANYRQF